MDIRNTFHPVQRRISVIRWKALYGTAILAVFFGGSAKADPTCVPFSGNGKQSFDLDACRPAPVSAEEKKAVLRSLPPEGEVTGLAERERRKLSDLTAVLRLHKRESVYLIKVISVPQAWIGLHARAVVLISLPALQLLDSEELQALVAHEVGHEYLWKEYAAAQKDNNNARLSELELASDGMAVLTLQRLGLRPDRLISGLEKASWFNREHLGWATNEKSYPSLKARRHLVKVMSNAE